MKKVIMGIMLAVMAVSLAACTPTTEKQKNTTTTAETMEPIPVTTGGASDKVPDPDVKPVAVVSIYHGSDTSDGLIQDMDALDSEKLDAQQLVDKLVEYNVLTKGTKVLEFTVQGEGENATAVLDLSQAESGEECSDRMLLAEIGNTFIDNYELKSLKLKVNGKNFEGKEIQHGDSDVLEYENDFENISIAIRI